MHLMRMRAALLAVAHRIGQVVAEIGASGVGNGRWNAGLVHGSHHFSYWQISKVTVGAVRDDDLECFGDAVVVFAVHKVDADIFGSDFSPGRRLGRPPVGGDLTSSRVDG